MGFRAALRLGLAVAFAAGCHPAHEAKSPPWWVQGTWVEVGDEALLGWKEPDRIIVEHDRVRTLQHDLDSGEVNAHEWQIVSARWAHDESWAEVLCGAAGRRRSFEFQRERGGHFASVFESLPKGYADQKGEEAWGSFPLGRFMSAPRGSKTK